MFHAIMADEENLGAQSPLPVARMSNVRLSRINDCVYYPFASQSCGDDFLRRDDLMRNTIALVLAVTTLAACGGSGGSDGLGGDVVIDTGDPALDALVVTGQSALDEYNELDEADNYTSYAALPPMGNLDYSGIAIYAEGTGDASMDLETLTYGAIGSLTATASFDGDDVLTATADGFFEISNIAELESNPDAPLSAVRTSGPIDGSFTFTLDILDIGGFAFAEGTVSGSLTKADMSTATLTDAEAFGDFLGSNAEVVDVYGGLDGDDDFQAITGTGVLD